LLLRGVVLSDDDRIATASDVLETFTIENPDASAKRLDEFGVLLICSLRDGGAACPE